MALTISEIREISSVLSEKLNLDINNFTLSFLRRRINYVFNELNVKNLNDFLERVKDNSVVDNFCYLFSVPDTEMFRDPSFWRTLKNKILPQFDQEEIHIWFPDLVSAEELFSLLVILKEAGKEDLHKIYCNIPSNRHLEIFKMGYVNGRNLEVSKNNFKRLGLESQFEDYFYVNNKLIYIQDDLISNVRYIQSNLYTNLPEEEMSLVIYRNRMLYFNSKLQICTEQLVHKCIKDRGYIALGIKEKISQSNEDLYKIYDQNEQIYIVNKV